MSIAKYVVAGLGAAASVSAAPLNQTTVAATPVPLLAAAAAASIGETASSQLTNVRRFNQLLTINGSGTALLPPSELRQRTVFDFNNANTTGAGGRFLAANVANFPILVDQGISTAVAFLDACSMNSPHTHPRATEWLTVVEGSVRTGFMLENGFLANATGGRLTTEIETGLGPFQGAVFPKGSIHFQFNDHCVPATFVATLNSEDPGTSQIAQNFFFEDEDVVEVVLGDVQTIHAGNLEMFRSALPSNLVRAVEGCLKRCGM